MDSHMLHQRRGCETIRLNPMSADSDTDTLEALPPLTKALSLPTGNGVPSPSQQYGRQHHPPGTTEQAASYKECLRNHAAKLGGLSLDGCGEFMPIPAATHRDPSSLKCAACGCHRNFHRRDYMSNTSPDSSSPTTTTSSPTPLDRSSPYYTYPHMLLGLAHMGSQSEQEWSNHHGSKRPRTKFSHDQKLKMHAFAEKLGWRMARGNHEEKMMEEFCLAVGVKRNVFKVWMHNNKQRKEKEGQKMNSPNDVGVINVDSGNSVSSNVDEYLMMERKVFGSSPSS